MKLKQLVDKLTNKLASDEDLQSFVNAECAKNDYPEATGEDGINEERRIVFETQLMSNILARVIVNLDHSID